MKTVAIVLVLGAVLACGGVFFGMFTIPGMEKFPTVEQFGKERQQRIEDEAARRFGGAAPVHPVSGRSQGLGARAGTLQDARGQTK